MGVQDKFKGQFKVKWIYVKDVPNTQLRHIRLENNENKPVTNSRDTQEVPPEKGKMVLKILHSFKHTTSLFDDFVHYEKKQEEEDNKKKHEIPNSQDGGGGRGPPHESRHDRDQQRGERGSQRGEHHGGSGHRGGEHGGEQRGNHEHTTSQRPRRGDHRQGGDRGGHGEHRGSGQGSKPPRH